MIHRFQPLIDLSQKYKPKQETGCEYVDAVKAFSSYTTARALKLPERWRPYLLDPLVQASNEIRRYVVLANKVYINQHTLSKDDLLEAYADRIRLLQNAMRTFGVFDDWFEQLMSHFDLMNSETESMRKILHKIILEEQDRINQTDENNRINIHAHMFINEISYTSVVGEKRMRLALTVHQRDHWLMLEEKAVEELRKRVTKDTNIRRHLREQITKPTNV